MYDETASRSRICARRYVRRATEIISSVNRIQSGSVIGAARPFSHYRLMLEYGEWGYCRQSIDIQNNHVVTVLYDTCTTPPPTIDELFDRIEQDMLALSGRCGVNGCGCDGTIVVSAGYDPRYGYPRASSGLSIGIRYDYRR